MISSQAILESLVLSQLLFPYLTWVGPNQVWEYHLHREKIWRSWMLIEMVLAAAPLAAASNRVFITSWATSPKLPSDVPEYLSLAYDAVRLILTAIKNAGTTDPDHVRLALSGIENFKGITVTISYRTGNRIALKSVSVIGMNRGKLSLIDQVMPEKVPAPKWNFIKDIGYQ